MKTEREIESLKKQFVKWLTDEESIGITIGDIVRTAEPFQNFLDACIELSDVRQEKMGDILVNVIEESQRRKGEERKDLYILEADPEVRLVVAI